MNVLKRFGKTALDAASSTLNYINPKVIKNKLRTFTNWLYDYVGPSDIDAVLNDTKDYIQSTYHGLKEFNFNDDLFRKDNASLVGNFILKKQATVTLESTMHTRMTVRLLYIQRL